MARFLALNFGFPAHGLAAGMLVVLTSFSTSASAQSASPMTAAPTKPLATNAAPILPPDTLGKYGKIVQPGDQAAHPLKLKLPLPDVGEVKIPSPDELTMRDKLEGLATLSDADIRSQLEKWPAYGKMSLRDQGMMLQRIQDFRDYRTNVANRKAHDMGLLTMSPDQQAKFEKDYWDHRLQLDKDLAKQFMPIFRAAEQKMRDDLYRKYSAVSQGPVAQAPKPPAAVAAPKPPAANPSASRPIPSTPVIAPLVSAPVIPPAKPVFAIPSTNSSVMAIPPVGEASR